MTDQTSDAIQREAERSRARVTSTLDELKDRLTPGQIIDDLMKGSGGGASAFMSNLGSSLRDHPIPALLIGAGVLMYMSSGNGTTSGSEGSSGEGVVSSAARAVSDGLKSGVEAAQGAMSNASDIASGLKDKIGSTASSASSQVREFGDGMAARTVPNFLEDQPLVMGALGFALGAFLGTALPTSDTEDALMGTKSDALKNAAIKAGKETAQHVGDVAVKVAHEASEEANRQGLSGPSGSLVDKIGAVGEKAVDALKQEVKTTTGGSQPSKLPNRV